MLIDNRKSITTEPSLHTMDWCIWWLRTLSIYDPELMVLGDDDSYVGIVMQFFQRTDIRYGHRESHYGIIPVCII